jgi:hypothetical protein
MVPRLSNRRARHLTVFRLKLGAQLRFALILGRQSSALKVTDDFMAVSPGLVKECLQSPLNQLLNVLLCRIVHDLIEETVNVKGIFCKGNL